MIDDYCNLDHDMNRSGIRRSVLCKAVCFGFNRPPHGLRKRSPSTPKALATTNTDTARKR